jgi:phosphate-selective porin OprO/OprP
VAKHSASQGNKMKNYVIASATLVGLMLIISRSGQAADPDESARLKKLEEAVQALQKDNAQLKQDNAQLKHEVSDLKKQNAPAVAVSREVSAKKQVTYDGKTYVEKNVAVPEKPPIYVVPRGPEIKLALGGSIQMNFEDGDVSAFEGSFGLNRKTDRFRIRRAKINLIGEFAEDFDFKIEGNFGLSDGISSNRTAFAGNDIFVNWHRFPEAQIKVGQWKAPFGLELLTPDESLFTIERSLPTGAITPERQIGAQLWGEPFTNVWPEEKDLLTYYVGIFNGNGRNATINDNNNFMTVGRLEVMPFKGKIFGQASSLKLGGNVLNSRDDKGTNISQTLNLLVNQDGSLTPYILPGADERTAWGVDAWLTVGPFDLIGEYLAEDVDGRTVAGHAPGFANFDPSGGYVQGSYFIIPKKLQAVVKWETLEPDQVNDDNIQSITGGLNYYIHGDSLKLMLNYIHTWSDFREAHPQFGDDQFDEVIGRLQVAF